jgi:L-rhamnose mutarotase
MKNITKIVVLLLAVLLAGCVTSKSPQRYAWVTGLKTDQAARYEYLHAHVWPGVNKMIKQCHIQNFSIHECNINGQLYLFAYLEYTGTNFDADMNKMASDPVTQSWWKQTDPCQTPPPREKSGQTQRRFIFYHEFVAER